jgi:hypothetical protein
MGEGGAIAPPAVIINAINDALKSLRAELRETPATPDRIRMGSFAGAIIGGLILGVNLWGGYMATGYVDAIGFGLVIAMLLVRPYGLFGKHARKRT